MTLLATLSIPADIKRLVDISTAYAFFLSQSIDQAY